MKKISRKLCIILVFCLIVSCMSPFAFADQGENSFNGNSQTFANQTSEESENSDDNTEIYRRESLIETLHDSDATSCFESVWECRGQAEDGMDELCLIESIFDCALDISTAYSILDNATGENYTKFVCKDRTEISISEHGDIYKISTIFGESAVPNKSTADRAKLTMEELKNYCIELMPALYHLFNIDEQYTLVQTYDFDADYVFFTFEKELENGITNPLQSINVVFNKPSLKFSIAVKFDSLPNSETPAISQEEALSIANAYSSQTESFDMAKLTYISDRIYNTKIHQYDDDICYLVYEVSSSKGNVIFYIDALSGEYVARDIVMSETGFAVAIQESANPSAYNYNPDFVDYTAIERAQFNAWRIDKITWAASAMGILGYNATSSSYTTSTMITDVRNYLSALGNEYAFYFTGHGNTTVLGFKTNGWIRTSDVRGNWHFVFLDACSTAVNTGWANAFKIHGYSNRAYLGWNGTIRWSYGYWFAEAFWPLVDGTNTIRQSAVDAAALVPGAGTTPIKFYGDLSYTGEAWS